VARNLFETSLKGVKNSWKTLIKKLKKSTEVGIECALRMVYKEGVWRKVKGWMERWEGVGWKD
jgi:hypothetical protein